MLLHLFKLLTKDNSMYILDFWHFCNVFDNNFAQLINLDIEPGLGVPMCVQYVLSDNFVTIHGLGMPTKHRLYKTSEETLGHVRFSKATVERFLQKTSYSNLQPLPHVYVLTRWDIASVPRTSAWFVHALTTADWKHLSITRVVQAQRFVPSSSTMTGSSFSLSV